MYPSFVRWEEHQWLESHWHLLIRALLFRLPPRFLTRCSLFYPPILSSLLLCLNLTFLLSVLIIFLVHLFLFPVPPALPESRLFCSHSEHVQHSALETRIKGTRLRLESQADGCGPGDMSRWWGGGHISLFFPHPWEWSTTNVAAYPSFLLIRSMWKHNREDMCPTASTVPHFYLPFHTFHLFISSILFSPSLPEVWLTVPCHVIPAASSSSTLLETGHDTPTAPPVRHPQTAVLTNKQTEQHLHIV